MKLKKILIPLYLSSLLVACSSHQATSFYQLKPTESINPAQKQSLAKPITILVMPIKFPEYLDRPQILIRDNDFKLKLSENHRWAEPLKNEFKRVLLENLNNRIFPSTALVYSELNGLEPDISVSIEVLQLDVNTDNQATLSVKWAYWIAKNTQKTIRLRNKYTVTVKNKDYQSRVEAQSQAITLFTDELLNTLYSSQNSTDKKTESRF